MLNKLLPILEYSRIYSLPMSIMSWLVIFVYASLNSGNILYGIIALIGICFVHLGTNLLDDLLDYKSLIKQVNFNKNEYLQNTQKTKCRYLILGLLSDSDIIKVLLCYFGIAALIGLFLFANCGKPVLYFMLAGGMIALLYSPLSKIRLSELSVALAYGPVLFGGVYYVMTKTLPLEVYILSVPTMIMTVVLLYIHTVMDFDFDLNEKHNTIANLFDSQLDSLVILKGFLITAYLSVLLICIFDIANWQVLLSWFTIPLAIDLYKSLFDYSIDSSSVPEHRWFHFPMENMKHIEKMNALSFMMRMYQSRNLMIYFSILLGLGLILSVS